MVYGYDTASQFQPVTHLKATLAAWRDATIPKTAQRIAITNFEQLGIDYVKSRLEVGVSYVLPERFALAARVPIEGASVANCDAVLTAFYSPRPRARRLSQGDIVFDVVDARPERKKIFKSSPTATSTSQIVVRAHHPCQGDCDTVPGEWALVRWDARPWVSTSAMFADFIGCLLVCDKAAEFPRLGPSVTRLTTTAAPRTPLHGVPRLALPAPDFEDGPPAEALEDVDVGAAANDVNDVLCFLASWLDEPDGLDISWLPVNNYGLMERLCALGAIEATHDEFGDTLYKLRPAGIRVSIGKSVPDPSFDLDRFLSTERGDNLDKLSKLELLLMSFELGFRPSNAVAGHLPLGLITQYPK